MGRYVAKRLGVFVLTLLVISLFAFGLLHVAPGDPVQRLLDSDAQSALNLGERRQNEASYLQKRRELGLDLPLFYVSIASLAHPDTLHRIARPQDRTTQERLLHTTGNWPAVAGYFRAVLLWQEALLRVRADSAQMTTLLDARANAQLLRRTSELKAIRRLLASTTAIAKTWPKLKRAQAMLWNRFNNLEARTTLWKLYIPALHWHGSGNQYHRWLSGLLKFELGISFIDQRPVAQKLANALPITLALNLLVLLLTYGIGVPLGVVAARRRNSRFDRASGLLLFVLYALPSFWVALLLLMFFAGGDFFAWFPASQLQSLEHTATWPLYRRLSDWALHLALPLITLSLSSFAFLSRQMRSAMLEVLTLDFIRTARAKGTPEGRVVWRHGFRNALLPLITLFASVFPALVGGAVIIETIFALPGMGWLTLEAIFARDYPVVVAVFTLSAFLTLSGIFLADLLYAWADPRVVFSRRNT